MRNYIQYLILLSAFSFFIAGCGEEGIQFGGLDSASMNDSGSGSGGSVTEPKVCPAPEGAVYAGAATDKYVVDGESLRVMAQGRYRFPSKSEPIGSAFAFKFKLGENQTDRFTAVITASGPYRWLVAVSDCPGDFDVPANCTANGAEVSGVRLTTAVFTGVPGSQEERSYNSNCKLEPNKPYYFNVRLGTSCTDLLTCDFYAVAPNVSSMIW